MRLFHRRFRNAAASSALAAFAVVNVEAVTIWLLSSLSYSSGMCGPAPIQQSQDRCHHVGHTPRDAGFDATSRHANAARMVIQGRHSRIHRRKRGLADDEWT